jgi:hypothetical protein
VQIHHVDDDPSNSSMENLAVLCLDCHTTTQIIGGFHRKLDAEQIILYREDWVANVGRERAQARAAIADDLLGSDTEIKLATGIADIYREANAYESLAMHYAVWGNDELRDKYIDLAIKAGMDDESIIYYRSCQGRTDLIPSQVITRRERRLKSQRDFVGLGRMYRSLNRPVDAVGTTCRGIIAALEAGNIFTAGFYLKEMATEGDALNLFAIALEKARSNGDIWWQVRALAEMDMQSEADELLRANKKSIEASGELHLLQALAAADKDDTRFIELCKQEAREEVEVTDERQPNKSVEPTPRKRRGSR